MAKETWERIGASSRSDQRGGGLAQTIILGVVLSLGGMAGSKTLRDGIDGKSACTADAIVSLTPGACSEEQAAGRAGAPAAPVAGQAPIEQALIEQAPIEQPPGEFPPGPILEEAGAIIALPFPGSIAVSCTAFQDQTRRCKGQPGVRVQATGEISVERSKTRLDGNGCPKQDLSVSGKLQVELSGQARGKTVGGTLAGFTGTATRFKVTVSPDAADAIAAGDRPPPNPVDPTSLLPGESLELSEEFFTGLKLQGTYRALQIEMGFEEGTKVSAGVKRIDADTVRLFVGDSEFVRQALSLGLGIGGVGASIGNKDDLSGGELTSIDIDISTPEGSAAYQEFLATGRLPEPGAPGTSNSTTATSLDVTDTTRVEGKLGPVKVGGVLSSSEAHLTETRHADGTVESVLTGRYNSVGLAIREKTAPDGSKTTEFSLLLAGADRDAIENFEELTGQRLAADEDGNVRLDFTGDDLRAIREQAIDQLIHRAEENGLDYTREDIELYRMGGLHRDAWAALQNLLDFTMDTARARHGLRELPQDHPDSQLPGASNAPDCG